MNLEVVALGSAVSWGQQASNSQFARKILPLSHTCFKHDKHQLRTRSYFTVCFREYFFNSSIVFSLATELKSALYASNFSTRQLPAWRLQHPIGSNVFLLFIIQSQFSIFWEICILFPSFCMMSLLNCVYLKWHCSQPRVKKKKHEFNMTKWQYLSASQLDASVPVPSVDKKCKQNLFFSVLIGHLFRF